MGVPYLWGAKPRLSETAPKACDCSGFSRWVIGQGNAPDGKYINLPVGSHDQFLLCKPVPCAPRPLDLGFADLHGGDARADHVVVRLDAEWVIEARGHQVGKDFGKVIARPVAAWEAQKGWLGWRAVPGIYA